MTGQPKSSTEAEPTGDEGETRSSEAQDPDDSTTENETTTDRIGSELAAAKRTVTAPVERITRPVERVIANSRIVTAVGNGASRLRRWIEASYIYRWFTAEPEPDVIVIDLRETRTIGPVIRVLDETIERLVPIWEQSRVKALGDRLLTQSLATPLRVGGVGIATAVLASLLYTLVFGAISVTGALVHLTFLAVAGLGVRSSMSWAELRETRVMQVLIAAFEPPEPPERVETAEQDGQTDGK